MSPAERAEWILAVLLLDVFRDEDAPGGEEVAVLQALQQLVQKGLARLWGRRNTNPGHVLVSGATQGGDR